MPKSKGEGESGGDDGLLHLSQEQLGERLARANRSQLKKLFGTDDVEQITGRWKQLDELTKAEEERKRAQMTEIERYKADLGAKDSELANTRAELAEIKFTAHVTGICAQLGIKNLDYAKWLVSSVAERLPEGQELDASKFLEERLAESQYAAAFGVAGASVAPKGASSSPEPGVQPPPAPGVAGAKSGGAKSVKDMSPGEFQAHLASLGVGSPGS
jgi:hypothetical protein